MDVVFFGSPKISIPILTALKEAGHKIRLIITQPDRPAGRGKKIISSPAKAYALKHSIPVYHPIRIRKDPSALDQLKKANPDINIVAAYGQILPQPIIDFPRYHSLNIHYSLLPRYRGASPVQWALLQGETQTGVTIFELNERMDEGRILTQEATGILPEENADELEFRLTEIGIRLLLKTLQNIDHITPQEQDHSLATYAPLIKKENGRIWWHKDAASIMNQLRAFTPWPSSYCYFRNKRIKIIRGHPIPSVNLKETAGKILDVNKEGMHIACGNQSFFLIETVQPENKKKMTAYAFSLGARIKPGDKLS